MKNIKPSNPRQVKCGGIGISRRTFLKITGLAGLAAAVSRIFKLPALGSVFTPSQRYQGEGVVSEKWIPTSCLNCATRCATRVRVVNGRAVKVAGNPLSQVSEGTNCARANIGLQVLYDPDRIATPLKRTNPEKGRGVDPGWVPVPWDQAMHEVAGRLKTLRNNNKPHQLLLLSGLNSVSDEDIINRFAAAYGTPNVVAEDTLNSEAEKAGEWMADGHYTQSAYDLPRTNYILSFGASILESCKPLARNLRMWGMIRRERPVRVKVVVIDPRYSVTALQADQWLPINPGTDGALAMSIANVIISEGLYDADFVKRRTTGFEEYKGLVTTQYSPESVAAITGIPADNIRQVAREFAGTRPAIAWRGRGATGWPGGSYASYAIFCLNALVGSIDVPGGVLYQENPAYKAMPEVSEDNIAHEGNKQIRLDLAGTTRYPLAEAVTNLVAGSIRNKSPYPVEIAIGFNSNLNMSAPATVRWDEALKQVPYYVHVSPFIDEMAGFADIVLPSSTFMESWAYDHSPPGSGFAEVRIKQPVVEIVFDTKSVTDIVFGIAGRLGGTVGDSFDGIGDDAEGFVRYRTETLRFWQNIVEEGVWVGPDYEYYKYDSIFNTPSGKFEFRSGNLEELLNRAGENIDDLTCLPHYEETKYLGSENTYPLVLSTYRPLLDVENGGQNYPWAQEMYLVEHGAGWTNLVEINSRTAQDSGIKDGDLVWVESPYHKIRAKARVFEGIHPQVVSIAAGQGHYANGKWSNNIGTNPNDIIGVDYDRLSGQSVYFNTRVKIYRA